MLKLYVIGQEKLTAARKMALRAWNNEEGASLAEYALLIALVLIGAAAALGLLTGAIGDAIQEGTDCLDGTTVACQ